MTAPVRVAQVVTRFIAGAGGVALRGAMALDPDRFEVTVVTGEGNRLIQAARDAGMEVCLAEHLRPDLDLGTDLRALRELEELFRYRRFDVVHTHSSKAGVLGRFAAHRLGVGRIVHTFHGFPFHQFQSPVRRSIYVEAERTVGRITDAFLAVGPAVAAEAVRRRIAPPERIRTIGVGIDLPPVATDWRTRAEARRRLGVPPGTHVVGTVGRLDYQKAPEDFVEAVHRLGRSDVYAVWVGGGPMRSQIERLVEQKGLAGRFSVMGERDDVAALLPGFDIFAMASRYEGLPCAVVEAMGAGLPVVATAVNAVPDIVVAGETGLLVPAERPAALAAALAHLLDHPDLSARLARSGRAAVGDQLRVGALAAVLEETYCAPDGHHPVRVRRSGGAALRSISPRPAGSSAIAIAPRSDGALVAAQP